MPILNKVNLCTFSQMFLTYLPGLLPDVVGHNLGHTTGGHPLGGAGAQVLTPPHTLCASAAGLFYHFYCIFFISFNFLTQTKQGFYEVVLVLLQEFLNRFLNKNIYGFPKTLTLTRFRQLVQCPWGT